MKTIPLLLVGLSGLALASESPTPETPPKGLAASDWSSIRAAYEAGRHAAHRQENGTLIARDPATGRVKLTLDWKKSTNLSDFLDFPAPAGSAVSISPEGDVEFEFPSADNAAFFRIELE